MMHPWSGDILAKDRQDARLAEAAGQRLVRTAGPRPRVKARWSVRTAAMAGQRLRAVLAARTGPVHVVNGKGAGPVLDLTDRQLAAPVRSPTRALAAVMLTDIVQSTDRARVLGDLAWRRILEEHNRRVGTLVARYGGRCVKHTGDGSLCLFDLPGNALLCAVEMHEILEELGLQARIGIHAGEVELLGDDVAGLTVHVAARVMGYAWPGETWTSSTVRELIVGGAVELSDEGVLALRGVGPWRLCRVIGSDSVMAPS